MSAGRILRRWGRVAGTIIGASGLLLFLFVALSGAAAPAQTAAANRCALLEDQHGGGAAVAPALQSDII